MEAALAQKQNKPVTANGGQAPLGPAVTAPAGSRSGALELGSKGVQMNRPDQLGTRPLPRRRWIGSDSRRGGRGADDAGCRPGHSR